MQFTNIRIFSKASFSIPTLSLPVSPRSGLVSSGNGSLTRNRSFQDLVSLRASYGDNQQTSPSSPLSRYTNDFFEYEEIGSGGFGKVYKVRNRLDGEFYAMKKIVFKKKMSHAQLKQVLREIKNLARLDHPNIVRYYQSWIEEQSGDIFSKRYASSLSSSDSADNSESLEAGFYLFSNLSLLFTKTE